ncbi:MAG: DUF5320 domain-containing protein [Nanoarchaeota archaeon]|nr:DUF5320 domain-containing protein [Nanoarchaeota archaeon]
MPNKDKSGPEGRGPRTGRGQGNCPPTAQTTRLGKGLGPCGRGLARGRR